MKTGYRYVVLVGLCALVLGAAEVAPARQLVGAGAREAADGAVGLEGPAGILWSAEELGGEPRLQLTVGAIHEAGTGPLLVGTGPEDTWAAISPAADSTRHTVELRLLRPPDAPLYLGCAGGDRWLLSGFTTDRWSAGAGSQGTKLEELWGDAEVPPPLPADWQPTGTLDARCLTVGREQRLAVDVGSVRLIMPTSATCARGRREEFRAEGVNTADGEVQLRISLEGPPWVWLPSVRVPLKAHQQIVLRPEVASFWAGESWGKVVFEVSGQEKAAPIRLECSPAYPALGAFLPAEAAPEDLRAALGQPVSLVMAPASLVRGLGPPRLGPEVLAYGSPEELAALAASEAGGWARIVCLWSEPAQWPSGVKGLAANQAVADRGWALAAGPLPLRSGDGGLDASAEDVDALARCDGKLSCVLTVPPSVPVVEMARAAVDGRPVEQMAFWQDLYRRFDPAPLRARLSQRELTLPIAWADLRTAGGSSGPAQGTAWAAAGAALLYQGATALCARWPVPDLQAWHELGRETAAAVPVLGAEEADIASVSAGAPVIYKPFLRGREGALVLTNTAASPLDVAVEVDAEPLAAHLVRLAPGCQPSRQQTMPFRFEDFAYELGRPLVFLKLAPGETALLSVRLVNIHPRWLRAVESRPAAAPTGPKDAWTKRGGWWNDLTQRAKRLREEKGREER